MADSFLASVVLIGVLSPSYSESSFLLDIRSRNHGVVIPINPFQDSHIRGQDDFLIVALFRPFGISKAEKIS